MVNHEEKKEEYDEQDDDVIRKMRITINATKNNTRLRSFAQHYVELLSDHSAILWTHPERYFFPLFTGMNPGHNHED